MTLTVKEALAWLQSDKNKIGKIVRKSLSKVERYKRKRKRNAKERS